MELQCLSSSINVRCKFSSGSNLHLLGDGISVTIIQYSPSVEYVIMQSLSLLLFVTMKIETEQIQVCISFNAFLTIFTKFSENICFIRNPLRFCLSSIIE